MCGRYVLVSGKKVFATFELLKKLRELGVVFEELPRYNAAPMQKMPVIAIREGGIVAQKMQWWLIPHWSRDGKVKFSTFNAKSETLEQSKLFSPYFRGSRCLVPADGFYEWKKFSTTDESRGIKKVVLEKQPYCIRMRNEKPFMFAALYSVWTDKEGEEHPTFAIITTKPNELMTAIHNRMPVVLDEKYFEMWLDKDFKDTKALKKLLGPYPARKMKAYPVSKLVSNSRNDVPECMKPTGTEL